MSARQLCDTDHVGRIAPPSAVQLGKVQASAFHPRPVDNSMLSMDWLEFHSDSVPEAINKLINDHYPEKKPPKCTRGHVVYFEIGDASSKISNFRHQLDDPSDSHTTIFIHDAEMAICLADLSNSVPAHSRKECKHCSA